MRYQGRRVEETVSLIDIVPTVLDEYGIRWSGPAIDGRSLTPLLTGREKGHRTFLADVGENVLNLHLPPKMAKNEGVYKFILNKKITSPYTKRMVRNFDGSLIELYDLEKDPKETKNLAANIAYRDLCFELLENIHRLYERADSEKKERDEVTLDQSLRERLRALGYIK